MDAPSRSDGLPYGFGSFALDGRLPPQTDAFFAEALTGRRSL